LEEVCEVYQQDQIPWVVGYSGGKDSTATLQVIWLALQRLPTEKLTKNVYVITTDTLVENPIVARWVSTSLETMKQAAKEQNLPIRPNQLIPEVNDTFWVNLIGRGYPAPRHRFRWCTERMKINPSNKFIRNVVQESGEAIVALGTRRAESSGRASRMDKYAKNRHQAHLSPNQTLANSMIYTPIEEWTNDDVWLFLMQKKNPWNHNNKDLLTMYQGASADGECPLVIDSSSPSCGDSRFGCWVCTMVDQDKSMTAMIQNDEEKEWMLPLLKIRNELDIPNDHHLRDFRRLHGNVQLYGDKPVPGPYTQKSRAHWLKRVLEGQTWVRKNGPDYVRDLELISVAELREIRRMWVVEKHELEDLLPQIYQEATGEEYPDGAIDDNSLFGKEEMALLEQVCGKDRLHYELIRELLDIERSYRTMTRRAGLYDALERAFRKGFFESKDDAIERAQIRRDRLEAAQRGDVNGLPLFQEPKDLSSVEEGT